MCRDGIVGAPLIYPFTHQRHHGQDRIRGPPTLFTRPPTTGPSFTLLFSSLFRRFFFPPHLVLHLPRPALPSTFLSLPLASSPSLPTLPSLSLHSIGRDSRRVLSILVPRPGPRSTGTLRADIFLSAQPASPTAVLHEQNEPGRGREEGEGEEGGSDSRRQIFKYRIG